MKPDSRHILNGLDGVGVSEQLPRLLAFTIKCNNAGHQTFIISRLFFTVPVSFFCDNLLFVHSKQTVLPAYFLKPFSRTATRFMQHVFLQLPSHSAYIHPRFNYFWFQQRVVLYCIALRCVLLSHRFMSELKDGCPIFCMDSSARGTVRV